MESEPRVPRGGRLHVALADSEADSPPNVRVLFRQPVGWVLLLGVTLALLCLPRFRSTFMDQAEQAWLRRLPGWGAAPRAMWGAAPDARYAAHQRRIQAARR